MALTPQQIADARAFINSQFGGGSGAVAPAGGWQFNGDFTGKTAGGGLDDSMNRYLLGAQQAMGYSNADMSSILGLPMDAILEASDYYRSSPAAIDNISARGRTFMADTGLGDESLVQDLYDTSYVNGQWVSTPRSTGSTIDTPGFGGADNPYGMQRGGDGRGAQGMGGGSGINNPYWQGLMDDISRQYTQTLTESWLPSIRSNAIASGGLGGARQTLGEDNAIARAGQGLSSALTGMGGNLWEGQQQRDLTRYGIDTNAALTNQGQWMGYDNAQRGLDLQSIGLGSQIMGMGQQMPWYGYNQMGGLLGGAAGNNSTTTNNYSGGGGWGGLIGGGLAGAQLGRNFGWW